MQQPRVHCQDLLYPLFKRTHFCITLLVTIFISNHLHASENTNIQSSSTQFNTHIPSSTIQTNPHIHPISIQPQTNTLNIPPISFNSRTTHVNLHLLHL